jgi:hypothetical protein
LFGWRALGDDKVGEETDRITIKLFNYFTKFCVTQTQTDTEGNCILL